MTIEQMSNFFTARVDGYDEHMIKTVEMNWRMENTTIIVAKK
jgi:hypothetical protein